ncbi:tRNA G10 N-methylase Trm11 [Cytobacillus eiseniae]|uniref:tRNA G10 N-methylase Trm11 n=1 Tax=Cytobacillus eiseniae TaxID=762947 RepID=A0ABS4R9Q1_9BACI|nr:methyltransferase domain-containing protein [Cytobacillus eiseniae]MBP2239620.1 tRNA G10 N-methylase Trm11 [Cytobacillus eiseniae]
MIHGYIYTFTYRKEEASLFQMEMRSLFNSVNTSIILKSNEDVNPSRSPFIKERIDIMFEGDDLEEIIVQAEQMNLHDSTFKVRFVKYKDVKIGYDERLAIERKVGWSINGEADVRNPDQVFGIVLLNDRWYFGKYEKNEAEWLKHMKKPHTFSTALSTRVARAVANIAVPHPEGVRVIDPCCGIGTVLVEALSMGIDITGRDINSRVVYGSRKNIAYFGFEAEVTLGPISDITEKYDVTIIDLPYNLYTHVTLDEQFDIIKHARRISKKAVFITIETIDDMLEEAGFEIQDRCEARKANFSRQILSCI